MDAALARRNQLLAPFFFVKPQHDWQVGSRGLMCCAIDPGSDSFVDLVHGAQKRHGQLGGRNQYRVHSMSLQSSLSRRRGPVPDS